MSAELMAIQGSLSMINQMRDRKKVTEQLKARKKADMRALRQASTMSAEEQQAMARMKKGAEHGTMDTQKLNMQMAQPLYQQGEAQEAQAMQKITQQGLEGSIVAQEASRKVGSDVRASIADQARKIAMENERTKADAARNVQSAQMKRGQLLRDIAMKKGQVMGDYKEGMAGRDNFLDMALNTASELMGDGVNKGTSAALQEHQETSMTNMLKKSF